ncbi:heavy metal-associated domain-containing protein [Microbacterium sp. ARD31]|jgi:copper chaperone CopZ|uniref:heavy-metal-associated domain-containing protein n=1 Tax=Methylobacterium fujisawaense TaxID=107400 RepID=UPI000DB0F488|nr:heavy metal-associated domain-containing protein [Microbacterium sp. ARD31]MDT0187984.1 heavy metal-associated domain-containing protein [Microbacterium sp. ARD31]MDV2987898.1 heavy metal-associated domain-containing protein [Methylobacteriaceae bacterium AG10]
MRVYKVTGMTGSECERKIARAITDQLGEDTVVRADFRAGEVRVDASADPQIVVFAIDSAGHTVDAVEDD